MLIKFKRKNCDKLKIARIKPIMGSNKNIKFIFFGLRKYKGSITIAE
jgi:hypothetical protein